MDVNVRSMGVGREVVYGGHYLVCTLLCVELEHLKIETRLIDEKFPSVKGECEI